MDDSSGGSGSFSSSSAPKTNWKSIYIIAVVAFITSLEFAASNDWNYFCQLETTATITFYGILRTVGGISGGIFTILAGWICNKLRDTREVLLVSKVLIFVAFCFFLSVELVHGFLFYAFFLIYKLLTGIANGGGGMSRTHVAMASTEADRAKAIALTSLFPAVGLLIGFSINAASSFMKYPGIEVPVIGIHLNLFTAPMLFNMLIFGVAFYLLLFHFDGKWHNYEQSHRHELAKKKNSFMVLTPAAAANGGWVNPQPMMDKAPLPPTIKSAHARLQALVAEHFPCGQFDWVGVCLCLFTQLVVSLAMLNLLTINAPYQQLAFEWDAAQLQFFGGLAGAAVAIQLIFWPAAYMTFGLNKIISERNSIICALGVLMANYLLTYSWPFLGETLHYAAQHVFENHGNGTASALVSDVPVSNCGSQSQPGCPSHYQWCASTTKPIMAVYLTSTILSIGMAMPILRMNLDILYSKMLGNIKQGVMQGLFFSCQIGLEMAGGPIIISWVFERTGPKHIWEFIGTSLAICLLLWAVFYKRMISNSDWHSQKEKLLPAAVGKSAISPSFSN